MKVFKFSFQIALFLCFFAFQSFSLTARSIVPVNDTWKAYKGAPNPAPTAVAYNDSAAGWSSVQLPHTFEYMPYDPEANYYKGIAYYRNHFFLPQTASGKRVFITFESAMNFAQVWCNGTKIGSHHYGWTPFTFEITNNVSFGATENILAVSADNTPSPSEPSTTGNFPNNEEPTDFIINSGLHRKVYITITDDLHIPDANGGGDDGGGIFVTYPSVSTAQAQVDIKTWVKNSATTAAAGTVVKWTLLDATNAVKATLLSSAASIAPGATSLFSGTVAVTGPSLWSPASPYRYTMRAEVLRNGTTVVDDYEEKIGIRSIRFDQNNGFYVNNQRMLLIGMNRHEQWPFIGHAVPKTLQRYDAKILKDMGCTIVRLSHYPQDPSFLDACDSLGIFLYEEAPGGSCNGYAPRPTFPAEWYTYAKQSIFEMVRRDRNRPSILCWGTLNEPKADEIFETETNDIIHSLDTTRPSTQSRNYDWSNHIYDLFSHGYYTPPLPSANPDPKTCGYINVEHTGHTYPTNRSQGEARLLEHAERYAKMVEEANKRNWVAASIAWCAFDYSCDGAWGEGPTGHMRYHGVADLMRIPKFAYYFYQSQSDMVPPMVHIANYCMTSSPLPVRVYSNCDSVRLSKWNGTAWAVVATQRPDAGRSLTHPPFTFNTLTSHEPGVDRIRAKAFKGGVIAATHIVRRPDTPTRLVVKSDSDSLTANGSDITRILISIVDENGTVCPNDTATINVIASGPGTLIGENPILGKTQVASGQVGQFGILLQSQNNKPGTVMITAKSNNYADGTETVVIRPKLNPTIIKSFTSMVKAPEFSLNCIKSANRSSFVINFSSPVARKISLQIFSIKGRLIKTLFNGKSTATNNKVIWDAKQQGSGIYLLKLTCDNASMVQKIISVR